MFLSIRNESINLSYSLSDKSRHVLGHPKLYSSEPSQQSQIPSLTFEVEIILGS
jgi:hypothetical protein